MKAFNPINYRWDIPVIWISSAKYYFYTTKSVGLVQNYILLL
jgi:hypothetical protein